MSFKFNPFTGTLDEVSAGGGGGGTPGGSDTQVQFNDGGSTFGGDVDLTWNKTTNVLTVGGDVNLTDGGTYTTTLQTITPTANRTISLPDATGTVALVGGSSGQLLYNNAGANAGASTLTYDGSILTTSGRFINSYNSGSLAPAKTFTGTWATGAGTTNTKPHVLIETTGATSNNWSNSGTGFGVNAASGFAGNLLDLQVNGTRQFSYDAGNRRIYWGPGSYSYFDVSSDGYVVQLTNRYGTGFAFKQDIIIYGASSGIFFGDVTYGSPIRLGDFSAPPNQVKILNVANQGSHIWIAGKYGGSYAASTGYTQGTGVSIWCGYGSQPTDANANGGNAGNFDVWLNAGGAGKGSGVAGANGKLRVVNDSTDTEVFSVEQTGIVQIGGARTVANLPAAPAVGMLTRVTDATAPAVGSTVAGGGAAAALVWYNGTNWTVIGV